ncbi:MAG: peptidoglycan-associated lipoprotein Pal [Rhodoblastus sp.]
MFSINGARALKFAAAVILALGATACAKNPGDEASIAGGVGGAGGAGYGRGGAASPGSQQDFVVNVGDRVFFESDSSELSPTARATLDKQSRWLQQYSRYGFTVEGHADERGTREYNFALGARRAEVVKDYLAARGIPASRIKTISYGKERPVAVCNDISCWSQNRRAVTVLKGDQS